MRMGADPLNTMAVDTLVGGDGNDTYYIGYLKNSADVITENATVGAGSNDTVLSFLTNYTLADNVETLLLQTGASNGTGDGLDNTLTGNSVSNSLSGGAGNDSLDGGVSDVYNPGIIDTLNGGAGNDTFVVRGFYGQGVYDGGADSDTIDFNQPDAYTAARRSAEGAGVVFDLTLGNAVTYYIRATGYIWQDMNGRITLPNIENVIGTTQSDKITGDSKDNILDGGVSDVYNPSVYDAIYGMGGNDTLMVRGFYGYTGYDAGSGNDWIDFSKSDAFTAGQRSGGGVVLLSI